MDEALSFHHGVPDVLLGPPGVPLLGEQDGPGARDHATAVLRMRPQVARHERRRFFVPAEVEESPGNLIVPEGLVGLGWHLADQAQAIFISSLVHEGETDASRRAVVARIDGERSAEFVDRFVQEPTMQVDGAKTVMRLGQVRVELQRAVILPHGRFGRQPSRHV